MTMEDDITLNLFVPSVTEEVKKKSNSKKKQNFQNLIDTTKELNTIKSFGKKKFQSVNVTENIDEEVAIEEPRQFISKKDHLKRQSTPKETEVLKEPKQFVIKKDSLKRSQSTHNDLKKKQKIKNIISINDPFKSSIFQHNTVIDIGNNDNIEPVREPLFSANTFQSIESLHPHLVANLEQLFNITTMTVVQKITIPVLLSRKDALVRSQTGSGKTLAYAIPIMNFLQSIKPKISRKDGVKALIVLPTRELALQTYECFQKLVRAFTWIVPGLLVGGEKRKSEKARLRKGITVLIGTPGRLLDHTKRTSALSLSNVQWLILDEADKMLDLGYEEAISSLLEVIKSECSDEGKTVQTVLLSATLTPGVEKLAGLALDSPTRLDASETDSLTFTIPQTLEQKYIIVPPKLRLIVLAATILYHCQLEKNDKVLIFMATQDMVNFYTDLLKFGPLKNIPLFKLHGNMTQIERTEVFKKFRSAVSGVLLCTDVGARGLDLPKTDVIIQYNAPSTPCDYVHRVGRTARVGLSGISILFLDPAEMNFLQWLSGERIKLQEQDTETYLKGLLQVNTDEKNVQEGDESVEDVANSMQLKFEYSLLDDKELYEIGCQAYKSWVRFYASYPKESRSVFCFKQLHLGHHAKSFALRDPPSKIGGIGKPSSISLKREKMITKKKKDNKIKLETTNDRTKRLIVSEFDSGIKTKRKKV